MKKNVKIDMTDKLKKCISNLDWEVYEDENGVYLSKYSPAGEDFGFLVDGENDETIIHNILQYANAFDPDDHAEMHIENRGRGGTPSSIRVLINDANDIKDMLKELADAVKKVSEEEREKRENEKEWTW